MNEQKQEVKNQEVKKVEVIQPKLCPMISGFLVEPIKSPLGQMQVVKTTNVAPCMEEKCKFFNIEKNECEILLFIKR